MSYKQDELEAWEKANGFPISLGSNNPSIPHLAAGNRPIYCPEWGDLTTSNGYRITDTMINEPHERPFRVIMIGAGAAGIDFLHHAKQALPQLDVSFSCFERNADVGGTWFENRYPGCACDIPSHAYQFAWRPNPEWTSYYSTAQEIWQYFKTIVEEEDLAKYITFRTEVKGAIWDEGLSKWRVSLVTRNEQGEVERELTEECDVFLNGTGFLNAWKWPNIPGLHDFKGKLCHTARYDQGYDLGGKRVAVIGSGSSGVQAVSSVYNDVGKLYTWVRTPTWITAGFGQKFAGPKGSNFNYSEDQKEEWRQNPEMQRGYSKMIERELSQRFKFIIRNSKESDEANEFSYNDMKTKLNGDVRLMDTIVPKNFNVGCRRPTPGNGFLEALVGEKTKCYTEPLKTITEKGFIDPDGNEVEVDLIICATGFDTSYRPRFPIIGLDGVPVAEKWKDFPTSYASVSVPEVPNYFMYSGPFTPVAQGSLLPLLTLLTKHHIQVIRKMRTEHIRRLSPKLKPTLDFVEHAQLYLKRTSWSDPCTSWFKRGTKDGPVVMWPGSRLAYFEVMKSPKFEDYEIEYWSGNRWGWLGNGFEAGEFDGSDITFYMDPDYLEDHLVERKLWKDPGEGVHGKKGMSGLPA